MKFELHEIYEIEWEDSMMMKKNPIAEEGWQYDKGDDHTDMKTVRVKSVGYVRKNNV